MYLKYQEKYFSRQTWYQKHNIFCRLQMKGLIQEPRDLNQDSFDKINSFLIAYQQFLGIFKTE